jgi:transcriptional regulator with XRE-family HTH domain
LYFGKHVRALREARGISLRQFAKSIGVSPTFVSRIENGHETYISEETLVRWAEELGKNPDYLAALAGKLRPHIVEIIQEDPQLFVELILDLGKRSKKKRAEIARKVKDGDW